MSSYGYDEAQYAAEYYALDAEVGAACLALAPQLDGAGVDLGDLDELCVALRRPVRDARERAQLMERLDPENAMRIDRAAVTTWLLEELFAASQQSIADEQAVVVPRGRATPAWEEIVEPPPSGEVGTPASVYYYNTLTGETAWALAHPFAACLYKHLLDVAEIRVLKAARDSDGFLDIKDEGEMVDDLKRVFAKFDDDRDSRLDTNEFRDLCVALAFPLGLADGENALAETMYAVDPYTGQDSSASVTWEALLDFWTAHAPWQRRTRLSPPPFDQWERLERLDRRAQAPWFRHVTTLRERWSPPSSDQGVVDLLMKLFPSSKLEWRQRVDMLWELQLQQSSPPDPERDGSSLWTLREIRALLDQLGWDHCTRREHVEGFVQNLQKQYGGGEGPFVLAKETLAAWMLDCVARVEMDGWEECVDESSGQRYYYHEVLGLTQWDPPQLEDRMAKMMARFGSGGDGGISREDQIKRIFRHYDEDESGSISFREFKRLYVALLGRKEAVSGESDADDAQIREVFSVLDTSGDDEVSLDEFMVWWKTKMSIEDEETEQQRHARVARERRRIAVEFLKHHDALIERSVDGATTVDGAEQEDEGGEADSSRVTYLFDSNILARLVGVLGKYPLKGLAYRDALSQLVHATRVVDQEILLTDFLSWYVAFEEREKEKEELAAQKARALALLQAKEAEAKEKARKLKMIRKGQLITKAIASDDVSAGGKAPEPAELIWKRHVETLFRKFDKDNSGYLDAAELKELTNALGHALDDTQIKQMMAIMDSSGDERISVDEFVTFWTAFQRRKRATEGAATKKKAPTPTADETVHRREAISMVDASANLAVSMELAKERALKLSINDVKDALGDWKESLLDRSRKKKLAKELVEQERARLEALKKEWAAFVPSKKSRYAHLDVTWIEPEVVRCMVDMIETVRLRARPLPREDAAQRIQRIMRGVVTRMRLFAMVLARFPAYVDMKTGFFYYVDTQDHGRVWLHRPLFHTITSATAPWDFVDCQTKVEKLKFRHRQREMEAKQRYHHKFIRSATSDCDREQGTLFVPASFVMFSVLESVRLRVLGNIWHALRDRAFVLAELMARRHWRQLTQRSNSDASGPLPLHHVVKNHRHTPFRLIQAIYEGHPDAVRERDAYGRTPLHLALRERAGERVLELLLSRRNRLIDLPTRSVPKKTSVWEMQSVSGETPLHVALRYGVSLELLRWICRHKSLLAVPEHGVVKTRNRHGHNVFHLVVSTLFDTRNAAYWRSVVLVLLKTWPPSVLCSSTTATGDLPLHLAIEKYVAILNERVMARTTMRRSEEDDKASWLWLIRLLVKEHADALLVRRKHDSLLAVHLLIRGRHVPESLVLETFHATVSRWGLTKHETKDSNEQEEEDGLVELLMLRETATTLLHYALIHLSSCESLLLTLLERMPRAGRIKMQPQDELPLHLAARHGAPVSVVTRLCEVYGAACQERNAKHELPLHLAVQSPHASEDTIRVLLHYCPFVLSDPSERRGLRALVMAANATTPNAGVLRALLDHTPQQKLATNAQKRHVTPLYAISLRKCNAPALFTTGILDEMEAKFEEIEDDDAYFTARAKAARRRQHHCPTASWTFPKILDLMEKNPVDEAIIQRALLALNDKLIRMMEAQQLGDEATASNQDPAPASDELGVVVETVTLNREWMLVRRVHQTLYELPWNARVQLLGQKLLSKLLPSAFAKAAYKSRVDPYFNL